MTKEINTGYRCSGRGNSGSLNTGNWNTGSWNSGHSNSGRFNIGNSNSGNWNKGDNTGGSFCTTSCYRMFNKPCSEKEYNAPKPNWLYFELTEWIYESKMTATDKISFPDFSKTGGCLKVYAYKEAAKKSWDETTKEDRLSTFELPNFDIDIFVEIFGIEEARDLYKRVKLEADSPNYCDKCGKSLK
jgi:hypothetical protein